MADLREKIEELDKKIKLLITYADTLSVELGKKEDLIIELKAQVEEKELKIKEMLETNEVLMSEKTTIGIDKEEMLSKIDEIVRDIDSSISLLANKA